MNINRATLIKNLLLVFLINYAFSFTLPEEYDVREHYDCKSFYDIRDQYKCGSCWAFATAGVISDRYCINSNGKEQLLFSEMELITCCKTLDDDPIEAGCSGERHEVAFHYWINKGLPTRDCKEYLFTPLDYPKEHKDKLKCLDTCTTKGMKMVRYRGSFYKKIVGGEEEIKNEIYNNGPVVASFDLYNDFRIYWNDLVFEPNKIYQHSNEVIITTHAIKIIGWGIDKKSKKKYWLCVNSWGKSEYSDGVFRFIRGINDCGIESKISAGYIDKILYSMIDFIYVGKDLFLSFKNVNEDYK